MAWIEPFKGLRPPKEIAEKVACPPYDTLSSKEARKMAVGNRLSFLRIIKPEIDLDENIGQYENQVYKQAQSNFQEFLKKRILIRDQSKNFYLYKQIWQEHTQTGLVAAASIQNYQDNIIKKHELTRKEKEQDRMKHIEALNANSGPVFMTFRQNNRIRLLWEKAMEKSPEYDFHSQEGIRHIFYVVDQTDLIEAIKQEFAKLNYLYIADGHHRSAAASKVKIKKQAQNKNHTGREAYNFFLSVLVPDTQLKILAYNRVVKDLNGFCKGEFFHKLSKSFHYDEAENKTPQNPHEFCLYIEGKWYKLIAKADSFDSQNAIESLDVSILQKNLLEPILGITDPRTDNRLNFVGGIRGIEELENLIDQKKFRIAFSLYPTSISQLFKVADAGEIMPPKSTWFEPKLKSGLIIHAHD